MNNYDINKCDALVKKRMSMQHQIQCRNRKKGTQKYCGIHLKAKNVIDYKTYIEEHMVTNTDVDTKIEISIEKSPYLSAKLTKISSYNSIPEIVRFSSYDEFQVEKILLLQKTVKKWIYNRRTRCVNKVDFYSMDNLSEIPAPYFACIVENGLKYGFDLRSISNYFDSGSSLNPFTMVSFSRENIAKLKSWIEKLNSDKYECCIKEDKLTSEQEFNAFALDVFQKINLLGNYADEKWLTSLSFNNLKRLYIAAEDIWNYRIQMPMEYKKKIIASGIAFIYINHVKEMHESEHGSPELTRKKLAKLILTEFNRFVTEGINIEERKTGAMLMLTALTEVSIDAANAMPQYVQSYQDPV